MSRGVKRVVAVVAAIAVPYLAPQIASSIGLSSAIGAAAANTATGALLGAGIAKATGGDPLIGAIGGGAGGYFGGGGGDIFAGPAAPAGTGISPTVTGSGTGLATPSVTPTVAPTTTVLSPTVGVTPIDYSLAGGGAAPSFGLSGAEGFQAATFDIAPSVTGITAAPAATDFGAQLGGATVSPAVTGVGPVDYGLTAGATAAAPSAGLATPSLNAMPTAAPAAATTAATTAAAAPQTFGEKAWAFTKSVGGDLLKTGAVLAAIGQPNIPGEIPADLLAQYEQDFARLAEQNPAAYQMQLQEAQKFLQMASTFDPQYFGEEEARKAQIRGAKAKRAGLRGLSGRQRAAAERQFDIATGREAGTSYTQGAQRALTGQIQTQEAGLKFMPRPSDYTLTGAYRDLGNIYSGQATARRQYATDIGNLADQATSIYNRGRDIFSS
jgi:hypothetical protein